MDNNRIIGLATDHAGFACKEFIRNYLTQQGFFVKDFGTYSDESADYPDTAHPLAEALLNRTVDMGIAFCGTGNGMAMALNRHRGIRAGMAWLPELAQFARSHNNANVCVIPARFITFDVAQQIADIFLQTAFEGGRHARRVEKIEI